MLESGVPQSETTSDAFNLEECQKELRDFYRDEMSKVPLSQWMPGDTKDMSNIYIDPLLKRKGDKETLCNEDIVDIKTCEGQRYNRVLIEGLGGTGKTVAVKNVAYKWAKKMSSLLARFTLVFVIVMREIQDSGASLIDLIFQQVLADDSKVSRDSLKKYIDSHAEDILLIVDGMGEDGSGVLENKYSEVTRTLHSRKLRESCLILTTRPEYVTKLGESLKNYVIVELHGFSRENIYLYIQKYFQTAREEATRLIREIRSREYIKVLASTPVLLLMMCLLWEDQCSLPETKTQIYQEMTLYLWKIYRKKQGSDLSSDSDSDTERFDECLNDLILKLGKVALDGSVNNLQVVFRNKDFKKGVLVLGCKANFITKKTTRFGATKKTTVEFLHALLQEYFAGVYLSNLLDTRRDEFDKNARQLFRYMVTTMYQTRWSFAVARIQKQLGYFFGTS